MKKLIFLVVFGLMAVLSIAQPTIPVSFSVDTISTSSSVDTVTFTAPDYAFEYKYEWLFHADSLSGSTGATAYVQHAARNSTKYVTITSTVIDGVQTLYRYAGSVLGGRVRLLVIAPSSTQSTKITPFFQIVRD